MKALGILRYPVRITGEFALNPRTSARNAALILAVFWRTIFLAWVRGAVRTLKRHSSGERRWSERARGRYIWRVAQRFWAYWSLAKLQIYPCHSGDEQIDWSRPHIIVANHQSILDILCLVALVPNGRFVAKKEVLKIPIIGAAARYGGQIIIDRGNHSQAMQAIRDGAEAWPRCNLIFFAEGTRTKTGKLCPFRRGAFAIARETGLPIIPVAINGAYEALAKTDSFLRFSERPTVSISFGREIEVGADDSVDDLLGRTRADIVRMLGIPDDSAPV